MAGPKTSSSPPQCPSFFVAPLAPARMTGMMPGGGDFEGILAWRFHRQGTNIGSRFESTVYGGLIAPGPQRRVFGEMTGEKSRNILHNGADMPGTAAHQMFLGPTTLGIYKNYAIEGGVQFPVYRDLGERVQRERVRYAVNFSYCTIGCSDSCRCSHRLAR